MPLDPLIANGIRPVEVEPYGAAAGRAMSLRQMFQHGEASKLNLEHAKRVSDREKLAVADDKAYRDTWARHGGDTKAVLADLFKQGNPRAFELQKTIDEREKAGTALRKEQLANLKEQSAQASAGYMSVKAAQSLEEAQARYTMFRNKQIKLGAKPEDMPEVYDPNFVESEIAAGIEADKQITAAQRALEIAETARHNKAGEAHQTATLTETARHNKVGEATQIGQLSETGRHNRVSETESGRHNRTTEGISGAQLTETRRHNQTSEGTAAIAARNAGGGAGGAKFKDSLLSLQNLDDALQSYKAELDANGTSWFPLSGERTKTKARFTDVQMQLKNLYALGAITGPDLEILNNAMTDPTTWGGNLAGANALKSQLTVFEDIIKRSEKNLREVYNQPKQFSAPNNGITVDTSRVQNAGGRRTVRLQAPNGQVSEVPAEQAQHFLSLGAKQVN